MHKLPPYKQKERQTKQKENVKKEMGPQLKKPNGFLNHHMLQTINELQESEFLIQKVVCKHAKISTVLNLFKLSL